MTPKNQSFKMCHFVTLRSQHRNNDRKNDNRQEQDSEEQTSIQPEDLRIEVSKACPLQNVVEGLPMKRHESPLSLPCLTLLKNTDDNKT
ncbi:hypothetical protein Ahy_A05g022533 isoform B [Arachis hypogaea]|uniref:Uncharacterized protein n=1 Tax=Arachis hypogaea TaxID=3818 RepID=A0A445D0Y0_ARAHY|nr:hypothetical protein Ahy_A05g022533 isoform B [Arachis hypogaea]